MLVAIIAAVVAALVAAAIIVVVLSVRNRAKTPYANSGKKEVQQLSTVGVGSSGASPVARAPLPAPSPTCR